MKLSALKQALYEEDLKDYNSNHSNLQSLNIDVDQLLERFFKARETESNVGRNSNQLRHAVEHSATGRTSNCQEEEVDQSAIHHDELPEENSVDHAVNHRKDMIMEAGFAMSKEFRKRSPSFSVPFLFFSSLFFRFEQHLTYLYMFS